MLWKVQRLALSSDGESDKAARFAALQIVTLGEVDLTQPPVVIVEEIAGLTNIAVHVFRGDQKTTVYEGPCEKMWTPTLTGLKFTDAGWHHYLYL